MTINKWFIAVAAIAISADVAYAADRPWWADRGLYIGAGAGRSGLDSDCEDVVDRAQTCEAHYEKSTSTKLFIGYQAIRYVAVEASHAWLGTFTETATSSLGFTTKRESKPRAFTLQVVGILPVDSNWAAQGWIGLSALRILRRKETSGGSYDSYTDYDFGYVIGAGVRYDFDRNVGVRAGIERHVCCSTYAADWIVYFRSVSVTYQFR